MKEKFPNSERWIDMNVSRPMTIGESYRNQVIIIELNNGRVKAYDGEHGMEPTDYWTKKEILAWDDAEVDSELTKILKDKFPQIKVVKVADL